MRGDDLFRGELTRRDDLIDQRDRVPRGHRHLRVVIAGCLAVDEISERISPVRFDQSEIRVDRFFQNVKTPVEFAGLLAGADWILLFLSMVLCHNMFHRGDGFWLFYHIEPSGKTKNS